MIILQNIIFTLQINISLFKNYININLISVSTILKKYDLKTIFHILMQHVNNLAAMITIQRKHDIMKNEKYLMTVYDAAIVYFKILMKHLNAEKKINVAKMTLLNSYFDE